MSKTLAIGIAALSMIGGMIIGALITVSHYEQSTVKEQIGISKGTEAAGMALKAFVQSTRRRPDQVITNWPEVIDYLGNTMIEVSKKQRATLTK